MNGVTEPLSAAIEWLKTEITRTPYGRLSIGVQVHDGKVAKVITACRVIQIDSLLGVQWAAKLSRAIFCSVRLVSVPRWCSASLVTLRLVFR